MFKTDSFLGNKKLSLNQNVWRDHATMQQDVLLHFWVIFLNIEIRLKYEILVLQSRISKVFLDHLEQFFLTVGQNNFGNKIPFLTFPAYF